MGGNLYRAPYYNRNLNIGPRIDSNVGQSPYVGACKGFCRGYLAAIYAGRIGAMKVIYVIHKTR